MILTWTFAPQLSKGPRSENGSVDITSSSGHNSSVHSSVSNFRRGLAMGTKRRSTRLVPGTIIEKPWLQQKSSLRYARYMIWISLALGVGVAAASKQRLGWGTHGSLLVLIQVFDFSRFSRLSSGSSHRSRSPTIAWEMSFFRSLSFAASESLELVLDERFDSLDTDIWQREVNMGGFGNGQFEWTTDSDRNA